MVALEVVRASNAKLKNFPPGLVAVFGILPTNTRKAWTENLSSGCHERYRRKHPETAVPSYHQASSVLRRKVGAFHDPNLRTTNEDRSIHLIKVDIYRSQDAAERIMSELKIIQSDAKTAFIQKDLTLLKNVDEVCDEIKAKETKLNLLFMTQGILSTKGRDGTLLPSLTRRKRLTISPLTQYL